MKRPQQALPVSPGAGTARAAEGLRRLAQRYHTDEFRAGLNRMADWANGTGCWAVVLTPWGVHRLGEAISPEQVQAALEHYVRSLASAEDPPWAERQP